MRFTALAMITTHITVTSAARSGESTVNPMNGRGTLTIVMPTRLSTDPAKTIAAIFAGADTSRMSSMTPATKMINAATTTPPTVPGESNTGAKNDSPRDTASPPSTPTSIAPPPRVGVADECTRRSLGTAMAPTLVAILLMRGTRAAVSPAETAKTRAKAPTTGSGYR